MFRMNVDGIPANEVNNIRLLANDSIRVFVEVTVDPDQPISVSPFVIRENIEVVVGSQISTMTLEAFGQNANYFPSRDAAGQIIGISCENENVVWDDPKPYVVYGLLIIEDCNLSIRPGTQVYVNGGIALSDSVLFQDGGLFFAAGGRLECLGTVQDPIQIQGSRLEPSFEEVAGQWAGIRFLAGSISNVITNTLIKNSVVGVRVDSAAQVDLLNVQIRNTTGIGLIGIHSEIRATNTLIHSNGPQSIALVYGGSYEFSHCTMANYRNQSPAVFMDNFDCVSADCASVVTNPLEATFTNSIIMGSNDDEIEVLDISDGADPELLQLRLDHTLLRVLETKENYPESSCQNCFEYMEGSVFRDEANANFRLDSMSIALDVGRPLQEVDVDITGSPRDPESPDLGCYEMR